MTYEVPGPNFEWMHEPYSPEQIKKFYLKEAAALSDKKGKRKASKEYDLMPTLASGLKNQ